MAKRSNKSKQDRNLAEAKRAAVLQDKTQTKGAPKGIVAVVAGLLAVGAVAWWVWGGSFLGQANASPLSPATEISEPGEHIKFPVAQLADGKAKYFAVKSPDGVTVRYFLVQDIQGQVRAAFDACDVCWRAGLGYEQQGEYMVCRNCGRRFATLQVGQIKGGCNPAPLDPRIDQGQVILKSAEVLAGRPYFDLAPRGRGGRS